jgi:hypothetical protein
MENNYNPYCSLCDSCGEDGCCSYLNCIFKAIESNEDCEYKETYKADMLLRHEFLKACFEHSEQSVEVEQFINNMYDIAYDKINNYGK